MILYANPLLKNLESYPLEATIYSKVKGDKSFCGVDAKDITELKFTEVEEIKDAFKNLTDENINRIFALIWSIKIEGNKVRALEFYRALNYVISELEGVYKLEQNLGGEPSQKLVNAGIDKLRKFGSLNIIDDIAVKYHKDPEEVEQWKYGKVYWLALKIKEENEVQKNLANEK